MEVLAAMQKSAEFESPVLEVIQSRRSRRAYSDQPVEAEKINSLFEAARWAPSSVNEQPWMYVYATKEQPELWDKIFDALNDANKVWAKNAYLLVASFARKNFTRNDAPNHSAKYDLGAANAFLSLQASHFGLNVHQMGGFKHDVLIDNLNVPSNYETGVVMAIGYPGDIAMLPENLQLRERAPRERLVQNEFVLNRTFDKI